MSNDERPDSLAAQAASWVPPWERQQRTPDREYQAAAEEAARAEAEEAARAGTDEERDLVEADLVEAGEERDSAEAAWAGADEERDLAEAEETAWAAVGEERGTGEGRDFAEAEEIAAGDDLADADDEALDEISADESDEVEPVAARRVEDAGLPDGLAAGGDGELAVVGGRDADGELAVAGGRDAERGVDVAGGDAGDELRTSSGLGADGELGPDGELSAEGERGVDSELRDGGELGADGELRDGGGGLSVAAATESAGRPEAAEFADDAAVDVPAGVGAGVEAPEPSVAEVGPELPLPEAIEDAVEDDGEGDGLPADAPLRGDDAGGVFDAAADDELSDDSELDLPSGEMVPDGDVAVADEPGPARPPTQAEAVSIAEMGPAKAGTAVPEQGRRRRDGAAAVGDAPTRTSDGFDLPPLMEDAELAAALEAILLVVDEPVAEMQLAQILEQPTERVGVLLEDLSARYTAAGHGFDLRRAAGGWRLYTRPEYAAYVERFVLDGQSVRLTQAALETLAVVAYKQPVTRSRISAIRGVNCDGVMRTLATRGLIEECGTESETGAYLYRTTALFLEKLGLNSVDQLPPLAPFLPDDVEEVLDAPG